jgi:ribose transport system substrate-binding protein
MRLTTLLATTAIAGLALAASPAAAKDIKIGMVNLSLCCAYFVGMDAA